MPLKAIVSKSIARRLKRAWVGVRRLHRIARENAALNFNAEALIKKYAGNSLACARLARKALSEPESELFSLAGMCELGKGSPEWRAAASKEVGGQCIGLIKSLNDQRKGFLDDLNELFQEHVLQEKDPEKRMKAIEKILKEEETESNRPLFNLVQIKNFLSLGTRLTPQKIVEAFSRETEAKEITAFLRGHSVKLPGHGASRISAEREKEIEAFVKQLVEKRWNEFRSHYVEQPM
ncbi:MAG: hypothetical protein V1494_00490 [Candidatus Diapherotrites archaeon]